MKRLSLLFAAAAMLAANAAQAQVVLTSPGASVTVATPAAPLAGTVLIEDSGARRLPSGYNETGRLARFAGDDRMMRDDMNFRNRDYEHWYPLEPTTRTKISRRDMGSPRSYNHPIADYETGRLVRYMGDERLMRNNIIFRNRDFDYHMAIAAPTPKARMDYRVHGLSTRTDLTNSRRVAVRLINQPTIWY
jgi:hypothetical protein